MIYKTFTYDNEGRKEYKGYVQAAGRPEAIAMAPSMYGPGEYDATPGIDVKAVTFKDGTWFRRGNTMCYDGKEWIDVPYHTLALGYGIVFKPRTESWWLTSAAFDYELPEATDFDEAMMLAGYMLYSNNKF